MHHALCCYYCRHCGFHWHQLLCAEDLFYSENRLALVGTKFSDYFYHCSLKETHKIRSIEIGIHSLCCTL